MKLQNVFLLVLNSIYSIFNEIGRNKIVPIENKTFANIHTQSIYYIEYNIYSEYEVLMLLRIEWILLDLAKYICNLYFIAYCLINKIVKLLRMKLNFVCPCGTKTYDLSVSNGWWTTCNRFKKKSRFCNYMRGVFVESRCNKLQSDAMGLFSVL